jgi:hypothetical protein
MPGGIGSISFYQWQRHVSTATGQRPISAEVGKGTLKFIFKNKNYTQDSVISRDI